jgi:hypothetical protein
MLIGTLVSYLADLAAIHALNVVGALPRSFPIPTVPMPSGWARCCRRLMMARFAQTIGVAATFAQGSEFLIDASQEFAQLNN